MKKDKEVKTFKIVVRHARLALYEHRTILLSSAKATVPPNTDSLYYQEGQEEEVNVQQLIWRSRQISLYVLRTANSCTYLFAIFLCSE